MFVACILVSYPLQFYVPMERIEKWIKRKVAVERQEKLIYGVRMGGVICTCLVAELIPHLALFISLVGSVAGTSLTLVFPPMIELLCSYSKDSLTPWIWIRNIFLMLFALFGFATGTYASIVQIVEAFGKPDVTSVVYSGIEKFSPNSRDSLTPWIWIRNIFLMLFALFGFATGTYASIVQIVEAFGKPDV
ncbi:unnamed protein product [Strongylus vulgaris]|uniref:Amino acid transporter transmembrane domain-containing protein n=1 Tax=Strongylus vulgaris TaxID=40348 RepID=A0A3P7IU55_STRVU|nr:unnamed protein product [Strongylus vulgaris]